MAKSTDWTEDQITVALYEYCRRPLGQIRQYKAFVKDLAELIGRTPGAIVHKVGNFASFDPKMKDKGIKGLVHAGKLDLVIWNKYYGHWDQLAYDAEVIIAKFRNKELEDSLTIDLKNLPQGTERLQEVKRRINQDFFRQTVISSYNNSCCITGINNPKLIQASHIVGWSIDEQNRTNPENGLCLNTLFHKAYDENLLGITPDYVILIADDFFGKKPSEVDDSTKDYIWSFNKKKIILPHRFCPDKDLLAQHFESYSKRTQ